MQQDRDVHERPAGISWHILACHSRHLMNLQAIQIIQNRTVSLHSQVDKYVETDDTHVDIC